MYIYILVIGLKIIENLALNKSKDKGQSFFESVCSTHQCTSGSLSKASDSFELGEMPAGSGWPVEGGHLRHHHHFGQEALTNENEWINSGLRLVARNLRA